MSVPGLRRCLEDKIRSFVNCVAGSVDRVVQASARAWGVNKEVLRRSAGRRCNSGEPTTTKCRLRAFHGNANRELATEILDSAEAVPSRVSEAHRVVDVNRHRQNFLAVLDALAGLRR